METVFTNADFISLDEHNNTYSVMVVKGKNIVYMGYSVPFAYDDAKVIDLGGGCCTACKRKNVPYIQR